MNLRRADLQILFIRRGSNERNQPSPEALISALFAGILMLIFDNMTGSPATGFRGSNRRLLLQFATGGIQRLSQLIVL